MNSGTVVWWFGVASELLSLRITCLYFLALPTKLRWKFRPQYSEALSPAGRFPHAALPQQLLWPQALTKELHRKPAEQVRFLALSIYSALQLYLSLHVKRF